MINELGKELRKIRLENDEVLRDMAKKLDISPSYLSAIENGKRAIPDDLLYKINYKYDLTDESMEVFDEIINQLSGPIIKINTADFMTAEQKEVFAKLAKSINKQLIDSETFDSMIEAIKRSLPKDFNERMNESMEKLTNSMIADETKENIKQTEKLAKQIITDRQKTK